MLLFFTAYVCILRTVFLTTAVTTRDNDVEPATVVYLSDRWFAGDSRMRHLMAKQQRRVESSSEPDEAESMANWGDLNCRTVDQIQQREFLSAGWTKAVYSGSFRGKPVAVKTVNTNGHDMEVCSAAGASVNDCYRKSAGKILKEIVLLRELVHDNMLKVLGYCIPNWNPSGDEEGEEAAAAIRGRGVAMVTELGEPMDIIRLLQMSWEDRLRICLGIARLLFHLAHSPLGSLVMNDFRRQQFVLVNGELKLSDVDDLGWEEPACNASRECTVHIPGVNLSLECVGGSCRGYNEKQNIVKAGRHFTTFLLPHGAPTSLRPLIDQIVAAYNTVAWDSQQIVNRTEKLVQLYTSGQYLQRKEAGGRVKSKEYRRFASSDLPGAYDYRCHLSLSGNGCTLSVFDVREAQDICNLDSNCTAFVLTHHRTWTGRTLVHFKSNFSTPTWDPTTVLYIKS